MHRRKWPRRGTDKATREEHIRMIRVQYAHRTGSPSLPIEPHATSPHAPTIDRQRSPIDLRQLGFRTLVWRLVSRRSNTRIARHDTSIADRLCNGSASAALCRTLPLASRVRSSSLDPHGRRTTRSAIRRRRVSVTVIRAAAAALWQVIDTRVP